MNSEFSEPGPASKANYVEEEMKEKMKGMTETEEPEEVVEEHSIPWRAAGYALLAFAVLASAVVIFANPCKGNGYMGNPARQCLTVGSIRVPGTFRAAARFTTGPLLIGVLVWLRLGTVEGRSGGIWSALAQGAASSSRRRTAAIPRARKGGTPDVQQTFCGQECELYTRRSKMYRLEGSEWRVLGVGEARLFNVHGHG